MGWLSIFAAGLDDLNPALAVRVRARYGGSREPEMMMLSRFVKPGDTVLDVGAHRGLYTWPLLSLVGRSGFVHAFEPQPNLISYLHVAFHRRSQVVLHGEALSGSTGVDILTVPDWSGSEMLGHATLEPASGREVPVVTVELDRLGLAPSFMKIDVEGHEAGVIAGAMETLRRYHPVLLLEIDRRATGRESQRALLLDMLSELGYRAHTTNPSGQLEPFDATSLVTTVTSPPSGPFAYNFFFLPSGMIR